MEKKKEQLIASGFLKKKTPGGYKGFRVWQKRFFKITTRGITYSAKETSKNLGTLNLFEIRSVAYLKNRRMGARFDIYMKNGRAYELHSESKAETMSWIQAINYAVNKAKEEMQEGEKLDSIIDTTKYSQTQRGFYDAYYGEEFMSKNSTDDMSPMQNAIIAHLTETFATDVQVLSFLLKEVFDPVKGNFVYDFTNESFDAKEDDSKVDDTRELTNKLVLHNTMTIDDMLNELSACIQQDVSGLRDLFFGDEIETVDDLLNADIPGDVPRDIADIIQEGLNDCRVFDYDVEAIDHEKGTKNVVETIKSSAQEFLRRLKTIFNSEDQQAHGLAIRVIWAVYFGLLPPIKALSEFSKTLEVELPGKTSTPVVKTLVAILLGTPKDVTQKFEDKFANIIFYMKTQSPYMWGPLLLSLRGSDMEIRKLALSDIVSLMHDNTENIAQLCRIPKWQKYFFYLFTDMSKSNKNEEPTKGAYAFLINVLTIIFYDHFMKDPENFAQVTEGTLAALHLFAGNTDEGQEVATSLLGAVAAKLGANKRNFGQDQSSTPWKNLLSFGEICKKFILQTRWWATEQNFGVRGDQGDFDEDYDEEDGENRGSMQGSMKRGSSTRAGLMRASTKPMSLPPGIDEDSAQALPAPMPANMQYQMQMQSFHQSNNSFSNGQGLALVDDEDIAGDFILIRGRGFSESPWAATTVEDVKLDYQGLHWSWDGPDQPMLCSDIVIVDRIRKLLESLRVADIDPTQLGDLDKEEMELMMKYKAFSDLWKDIKEFVKLASRQDIIDKLYTYRRLSFLTRSFASSPSHNSRLNVIKEYVEVIKKGKKKRERGLTGASTASMNTLDLNDSLDETLELTSKISTMISIISKEMDGAPLDKYLSVLEAKYQLETLEDMKKLNRWETDSDIPKKVVLLIQAKLKTVASVDA